MGVDSSSKVESPSGVLQGKGQLSVVLSTLSVMFMGNKPKLRFSAGSSAHALAQWVGQRPHKNSRTRRTNLVSPVIKHAESKISTQSFATSDFSPRASSGTTGSLSAVDGSPLKMKRELKNASSPYRLSESEDSEVGDIKTRECALASGDLFTTPKTRSLILPARKNRIQTSHKGGGTRKQGKSESVSSLTTPGFHLIMVKSENLPVEKPRRNVKIASDKNRK